MDALKALQVDGHVSRDESTLLLLFLLGSLLLLVAVDALGEEFAETR